MLIAQSDLSTMFHAHRSVRLTSMITWKPLICKLTPPTVRSQVQLRVCALSNTPSGTPPVETTTSRNNNARKNSQNFRRNPHKLSRIPQISIKSRKNRTFFAKFGGNLQNSAQFVGIPAKIQRNFASIFVSTGRCFDWWRPAWIVKAGPESAGNSDGGS